MKKVLVILHLYYQDQIDWFLEKLRNINNCEWDLIISYNSIDDEVLEKLRNYRSDVRLFKVENSGYDVWPFISVLKSTDLEPYDYILKLHTKNTDDKLYVNMKNGIKVNAKMWRNILIDAFLKSPKQFRKCLRRFDRNPDVGMICSDELFIKMTRKLPEERDILNNEATRIGLKINCGNFCAGTMFMVKPVCLRKIINAEFEPSMWVSGPSHSNGTLAHVYERIFCIAVVDAGYRCATLATSFVNFMKVRIHRYLTYIFTLDRDKNNRKYLVLLGHRIVLTPPEHK